MRNRILKWAAIAVAALVPMAYLAYAVIGGGQLDTQEQSPAYSVGKANGAKQYASGIAETDKGEGGDFSTRGLQAPAAQSGGHKLEFGSGASQANYSTPALDERIIRTASIELEVKRGKFDYSYDRAVVIANGIGGYVSQSKSRATNGSVASGEVVMRIPARAFEKALSDLKQLGKVKSLDVTSEDVSEEYVDLESRLKHWKAQEAIVLDLMRKAKSISESITIQNSLSQIQIEIETISGRLKFLENRTSYATIHLYMAEPQAAVRTDTWGFNAAVKDSVKASAQIVASLIVFAGYLFPLSVLAGIGYIIYRLIRNSRRRFGDAGL